MDIAEENHLKACHDSTLYQKLIQMPVSNVALLRRFSFYLCFDVLKINWTDFIFGQLSKLFDPFRKLALTTITFYATKESPWGYSYRTVNTFIELIGSMESLEHIQWFENTHKREGETTIKEYRDRFQHYFGLVHDEIGPMGKYAAVATQMRCTPINPITKTAIVTVNGIWCDTDQREWAEGTSSRDVRVTIASFAEAKALDNI